MIDRLSLSGGLSKYICIYHKDGPRSDIGRLSPGSRVEAAVIHDRPTSLIGGFINSKK